MVISIDKILLKSARRGAFGPCGKPFYTPALESDRDGSNQPEIRNVAGKAKLARHIKEGVVPKERVEAKVDASQNIVGLWPR